jgi:hypothetical protein
MLVNHTPPFKILIIDETGNQRGKGEAVGEREIHKGIRKQSN